jgi:hypothetical protein
MIKWLRPLAGLVVLVLMVAACGGGGSASPAASAEGSAPPAATDAPATEAPPAGETPAAGGPDVAGAAAALSDLESYHLKLAMRLQGVEDGTFAAFGDGLTMEGTVIFKPVRAADITMAMGTAEQPLDMGYRVIGDQAWISMGGSWMETPADDAQQTIDSLAPEKLVSGFGSIPGLATVGDETKNGVATTHYSASGDALGVELNDVFGLADATWTVDFWVAKDGGYAVAYSVLGQGSTGLFEMTLDVSGINDPSNVVEPPPAS